MATPWLCTFREHIFFTIRRTTTERKTHLTHAIELGGLKAKYDAEVKKILSDIELLARIMKAGDRIVQS